MILPRDEIGTVPNDRGFGVMRAAFRMTGGIARCEELSNLMEDHARHDFLALARLIVSGAILGFHWHQSFWIPMFQFELRAMTIKPGPLSVLAELTPVLDGWIVAAWFARPNDRLGGVRPVTLLDMNLPGILAAARSELAQSSVAVRARARNDRDRTQTLGRDPT